MYRLLTCIRLTTRLECCFEKVMDLVCIDNTVDLYQTYNQVRTLLTTRFVLLWLPVATYGKGVPNLNHGKGPSALLLQRL